jgi:uncharacterized protein (TIGR03000 family)
MLKRWFPVAGAGALALVLMNAGTCRAQLGGFWGGWGTLSPWSGTGGWTYWPGGIGANYVPGIYNRGGYGYGGIGSPGLGMWMNGGYPYGVAPSLYNVPTSVAVSPMNYVAFYPPVYTTRAPVVAPVTGLVPLDQEATVEVTVPADAVVLFDGHQTSQTGTNRLFATPPLAKGKSFYYLVEATFQQNGKSVTKSQRVQVYSGGRIPVVFPTTK